VDCIALDDRFMNWKGFGRKRSWPNRDTIPAFAWNNREKGLKTEDFRCPAEARNEHLPKLVLGIE
jgi:hypothetical protein